MSGRRFNCGCGKKRYRDEPSAAAAAAAGEQKYGEQVTVYRCPGGSAWHLTTHGFVPEALRSVGRRLAYELLVRGRIDLTDFGISALRLNVRPDPRRARRIQQCADKMTELGLACRETDTGADMLYATDLSRLRRVVQVGLDAYRSETI